jgi:hypothetical protein
MAEAGVEAGEGIGAIGRALGLSSAERASVDELPRAGIAKHGSGREAEILILLAIAEATHTYTHTCIQTKHAKEGTNKRREVNGKNR